jgi:hypothetical protein
VGREEEKEERGKNMRWITARVQHLCAVCKETINPGEVVIQSEGRAELLYHEGCHWKRFQGSAWHEPKNEKPEAEVPNPPD